MLDDSVKNSKEYEEYEKGLGKPLEDRLIKSMFSGGRDKLVNLFIKLSSAELLEESPYTYLRTTLIGKANSAIRYEN